MASHKDLRAENVVKSLKIKKMSYIQVLFFLSKKNTDFKTGGGFIVKNNKRIIHDDHANSGDIIIYNGKVEHGVQTIDQDEVPNDNFKKLRGRFVLLCNFYRSKYTAPKRLG